MLRNLVIMAALGLGSGAPEQLSKGINNFSMDLYRELTRSEKNFVASPFNLSTSLAMAYVGATGDTAHQMARTLHYPTGLLHNVASSFYTLVTDFGQATEGAPFALQLASSIWLDKSLAIEDAYKSTITADFPGGLHRVDFSRSAPIAEEVNKWASDETAGKVTGLLQDGDIDAITRLLLVSTLYFKAPWETRFNPANTEDRPFQLDSQRTVQAPMMRQVMSAAYADQDGFKLLSLHYASESNGAQLAFVILLPDDVDGLPALEEQFTSQWLSAALVKMVPTAISVEIPKLSIKTRLNAEASLKALGMPLAFSPQADFSGISGSTNLSLNAVIHEAFIELDEEGTEAGAATAAAIGMTSAPQKKADVIFRATHPFAFAIIDLNSAQILFVGRVMDPTQP